MASLVSPFFFVVGITILTLILLTTKAIHYSEFKPETFFISVLEYPLMAATLTWCAAISFLAYIKSSRRLPVYLLSYSCHKPDFLRRGGLEFVEYFGLKSRRFSDESADFMRAIYAKSGLGDETYAPAFMFQSDYDAKLSYAYLEAEEGLFEVAGDILRKTGVSSGEVSVLIVACSMFSPSPSLSSMLVNHLKLSPEIKTFNLSGMGCSAGTIAVDLAAGILRRRRGYALIVVTESTSLNWYAGDNRHMLVTNCIFRCGTAAVLLGSDPVRRKSARLELVRTLRTHHGANDAAYNAATQCEDEHGVVGVALTKDLVRVAGAALRRHITILAPYVLPVSELLRYVWLTAKSSILHPKSSTAAAAVAGEGTTTVNKRASSTPMGHVPDFTKAFDHVCLHAGGKAVVDAVARLMQFSPEIVEPARMCLHRFGNTSSSLVFYELAYFDAQRRIKSGDRVWMLAFGTGFKACSIVWKAVQDSWIDSDNPWKDCIHRYPVT